MPCEQGPQDFQCFAHPGDVGCSGGRVIVFTETKNDAGELSGALESGTARALHGDIAQAQREVCHSHTYC